MTRRRWIADEVDNDRAALTGEHAAHLSRHWSTRVGRSLRYVTVRFMRDSLQRHRERVGCAALNCGQCGGPHQYLCAGRVRSTAWGASKKSTELNVTSIVPLIACRTESTLPWQQRRVERWRRIARSIEQAHRAAPPEIAEPIKLSAALELAAHLRIVPAEQNARRSWGDAAGAADAQSLAMAIGRKAAGLRMSCSLSSKQGGSRLR
jgi:hypothetical protein